MIGSFDITFGFDGLPMVGIGYDAQCSARTIVPRPHGEPAINICAFGKTYWEAEARLIDKIRAFELPPAPKQVVVEEVENRLGDQLKTIVEDIVGGK